MAATLATIFPDDDYKFEFRFERVSPEVYFAPTAEHERLTKERRFWLGAEPEKYLALSAAAEPLMDETRSLAQAWTGFPERCQSPAEQCRALGQFWETDFLLLKADEAGVIHLEGGCLCFPSSWRLTDKLGQSIEWIHGPVPGLNPALGAVIHKFLSGLKTGVAHLRHNWGLARSPELNHHPDRALPRLDASVSANEVWLRVEHQALVALPKSRGILFGIRVVNHPLIEVIAETRAKAGLRRALETMPEPMAVYKGIAAARGRLLELLKT